MSMPLCDASTNTTAPSIQFWRTHWNREQSRSTLLLATRYNRAMMVRRRLIWLPLVALLGRLRLDAAAAPPNQSALRPSYLSTTTPCPRPRRCASPRQQTADVASVEQALGDAPRSTPSSQATPPTQQARAALQQARQAYQQLRFRDALEALTNAQQTLVATSHDGPTLELLRRVALSSVLNHLALKNEQAAKDALGLALSLGYDGPEPGELPPETV